LAEHITVIKIRPVIYLKLPEINIYILTPVVATKKQRGWKKPPSLKIPCKLWIRF